MNVIANNIIGPWGWNPYEYISIKYAIMLLCVVVFYLILYKLISKQPLKFPLQKDVALNHYSLAFEEVHYNTKKVPARIRFIACLMTVLLIITPMNELMANQNFYSIWELIF